MDENKTVNYSWLKFKCRVKLGIEKTKEKAKSVVDWCAKNPAAASAIAATAVTGFKTIHKAVDKHNEDVERRRRIWDPREGRYVWLNRDITPREDIEIRRRYRDGESYGEILNDMGLRRR